MPTNQLFEMIYLNFYRRVYSFTHPLLFDASLRGRHSQTPFGNEKEAHRRLHTLPDYSTRSVEEGIPKQSLGTRNKCRCTQKEVCTPYQAVRRGASRNALPNGVWERETEFGNEKRHSQTEFGNEKLQNLNLTSNIFILILFSP